MTSSPADLHAVATSATRAWLERAVIGLQLCPFAKAVYLKEQIRITVSLAKTTGELRDALDIELRALSQADPSVVDTTLLIHPMVLTDFLDFNDFLTNFTNRSPYPMLQLLREASVSRAIAAFPDAQNIYRRNLETMRRLGASGWTELKLEAPSLPNVAE